MPVATYTLKYRHALAGPSSTWAANWASWTILLPIIDAASSDVDIAGLAQRNVAYVESYPTLTDAQAATNGIAGDSASIVITGPPTYFGFSPTTGHEWRITAQITVPEYFHASTQSFPLLGDKAYVAAPYHDVWVVWNPTGFVPSGDDISGVTSVFLGTRPFIGGESLYPLVATRPTVTQDISVDEMTVHAEATASSAQGAIEWYGWQIRDSDGKFLGTAASKIDNHPWGPYVALGQTIDYELEDEGTYSIRCVVFDEYGYISATDWATVAGGLFEEFTVTSGQFDSLIDATGALFSAVNEGTGVRVSRFRNGVASREPLALIADAKNPAFVKDKQFGLRLSYTDRNDGAIKMVRSTNDGREFS